MLPKQPLIRAVSTQRVSVASKASAKGERTHRVADKGGRMWYGKQKNWSFVMGFWHISSVPHNMWWNGTERCSFFSLFTTSPGPATFYTLSRLSIAFHHCLSLTLLNCCHMANPIIQTSYKEGAWHLANFLKVCVIWQTMKARTYEKKEKEVKPDF